MAPKPKIPDDSLSRDLKPGNPSSPSPLMGEGWGGGGDFSSNVVTLLKSPPSPNPLPPGEGA
jgi:hypothetical protein